MPWGWIALVTVLSAAVSVAMFALPVVVGRALDGTDDEEEEAARELTSASADLLTGLRNERSLAVLDVLGMPSLLQLPVEDTPEARQATDQALADLEAAVSDTGDELASESDYEDALTAVAGLDRLRDGIDSRTQPAALTEALATQRLDMSRLVAALGPASGAWQTFIAEVDGRLTREIGSS